MEQLENPSAPWLDELRFLQPTTHCVDDRSIHFQSMLSVHTDELKKNYAINTHWYYF